MPVNSIRLGVFFGIFLAVVHAAWAVLVAVGWAQILIDFVFWAHLITPPFHVVPFELMRAVVLILCAFVMGLALGTGGGIFWNRIVSPHR